MKKKFSPSYTIPVYKRGYRSFIEFWALDSKGTYSRYRPTFNLNRIHHLPTRDERGWDLCAKIRWWLEQGNCIDDFEERKVILEIKAAERVEEPVDEAKEKQLTDISEALQISRKVKHSKKDKTNKSYRSHARRFLAYLDEKGSGDMAVGSINRTIAMEYLDYYKLEREVTNNTLNNVITHMRSLFTPLVDRGYINANPFSKLPSYRKEDKIRRNFEPHEAKVILSYVQEHDKVLFYSILLQYVCLIRPSELLRLRFCDIRVDDQLVVLERGKTKFGYQRVATIPQNVLIHFKDSFWSDYPKDYLLFGEKLNPHPTKPAGEGSLYRRHQKVLQVLFEQKKLSDLTGLQYYSWKDTGVTDIIEVIGLMAAYDQTGHRDIKQTMKYRHKRKVNPKLQNLQIDTLKQFSKKHSN